MAAQNKTRPFGMRDYFGYAMGDFGCNMSFALITNYLMLFYTQYVGLELKDWAWIIIVGKVWDAINDPLIGGMVDNVSIGKGSKFMPWITIGGSSLIIFTTLSFMPIASMSYIFKVIYCLAIYCIWSVAYTMANVPYGALHSCITNDPSKRTNLSTFRSIGAGLAQVLTMLLPLIVYDKDHNLIGLRMVYVALVCSAIGFAGFMLVRLLVTERVAAEAHDKTDKMSYLKAIKGFFTNRPLLAITAVSFAQVICFMSMSTVNVIIFQSYFHNTKILAAANIVPYLPLVVLMPFIGKITKKIGKKKLVVIASSISLVAGIISCFIPMDPTATSSLIIYMGVLMLLYTSNAVFTIILWAMVVDCIDYQYEKTGSRDEGSRYALFSFFRKLAQGLGSALSAGLLAVCGYVESLGANQTAQTALNIKNMYLIVMTVGVALTVDVTQFVYNINKDRGTVAPIDIAPDPAPENFE